MSARTKSLLCFSGWWLAVVGWAVSALLWAVIKSGGC
jgi:hypothetical protein